MNFGLDMRLTKATDDFPWIKTVADNIRFHQIAKVDIKRAEDLYWDSVTLSIRGQNTAFDNDILNKKIEEISGKYAPPEPVAAVNERMVESTDEGTVIGEMSQSDVSWLETILGLDKEGIESALTTVENLWSLFMDVDDTTAETMASGFLRLAVDGMDEYSIWYETIVKPGMTGNLDYEELPRAWEKKTQEMGLDTPFDLSSEELLSVVDDLTRGKELKVMNYVKGMAECYLVTESDKEVYFQAHETLFKGAGTEDEKWNMIATEQGVVDPSLFVAALRSEAVYKSKPLDELSRDDIMEIMDILAFGPSVYEMEEEEQKHPMLEPPIIRLIRGYASGKGIIDEAEPGLQQDREDIMELAKAAQAQVKDMEKKLMARLKDLLKRILQKILAKAKEADAQSQKTPEQAGSSPEVHVPKVEQGGIQDSKLKGDVSVEIAKDERKSVDEEGYLRTEPPDSFPTTLNQEEKQIDDQVSLSGEGTTDLPPRLSKDYPDETDNDSAERGNDLPPKVENKPTTERDSPSEKEKTNASAPKARTGIAAYLKARKLVDPEIYEAARSLAFLNAIR